MIKVAKKKQAAPGGGPAELVLPGWKLQFGRRDDPPHRRRIVAECEIANEHGTKLKILLVSNWPRTKWWARALYLPATMRASATLATTSAKKAAEWEAAIRAERVRIADE